MISVRCSICRENLVKVDRKKYEEMAEKGVKPLCKDCGLVAFFGGK
jgi:hypothetical protein